MGHLDTRGQAPRQGGFAIFALLPDGSPLLRRLGAPPAGTKAGLKLCYVSENPWGRGLDGHIHAVNNGCVYITYMLG
jgi:hypothetical protein